MNQQVTVIPNNFGAVSTKFQNAKVENDLAAGVQAGFGLIGYKGKVWSIRYRGDEQQLLRDDGDGPRNSVELVILKGSTHISKIWYEKGYIEGSTAAPDCFSPNGITPDPASTKRQSNTCANCPQNVWGSKMTEAGKKGKACSDSKRLAVVPVGDILNEAYGGAMLLRVPAASLQDLASYGNKMAQLGYPYYAVATRVSFDPSEAYPKFLFQAIRPLSDDEADQVLLMQNAPEIQRVLAEGAEHQTVEQAADEVALVNAFEQPPKKAENVQNVQAKKAAPAKQEAKQEPKQEQTAKVTSEGNKQEAKKSGFGPTAKTAKVDQQTTQTPTQTMRTPPFVPDDDEVVEAAVEENGEEAGDTPSDIELSLDEQLAKLLPSG